MFYTLTQATFNELAQQHRYVVVYKELLADTFTPISAFECLVKPNDIAMLLESGLRFHESGSYSFIGVCPYASFQTKNGQTTITAHGEAKASTQEPLTLLRQFHQQFKSGSDEFSKLAGHMMGFLAYDAVRYFEEIPNRHHDDGSVPDILFNFYRINLIFNHENGKILVACVAQVGGDNTADYQNACKEIDAIITQLKQSSPSITATNAVLPQILTEDSFETDCSDEVFKEKVERAKEYIRAGDAFQIVLSRTFSRPINSHPLVIYRILRNSNPTPYMFYLTMPGFTLFGASPEKVVSMQNRVVTIAPIAGTVPIPHNSNQPRISDEELLKQLRDDPKQRAEHTMLVDLARNDIGSVCEPGSVYVADLMTGERLTHVMHLVSYVKGRLASQYDAFDLLKATFPAGTLSGAPKIRAMEIIDELEASKRHLYGGAVGKVDGDGNLDSCIIIRSGVVKDGVVRVRAGGGIVYDSKPQEEADETRHKARGVFRSVIIAEQGGL